MEIAKNLHAFFWESMTSNNCNTYLINGAVRILIDPGHAELFGHVEKGLEELNLGLDDIDLVICTHAHPDHIEAAALFESRATAFTLNENEWRFLKEMSPYVPLSANMNLERFQPAFFLQDGFLAFEDIDLQVIHTPGHSPGSICIYWPLHKVLITGDLIFKEGIGRTDLPGGNGSLLKNSIKQLMALDLDIEALLPGHGGIVSGTHEVKVTLSQIEQFWFNYI